MRPLLVIATLAFSTAALAQPGPDSDNLDKRPVKSPEVEKPTGPSPDSERNLKTIDRSATDAAKDITGDEDAAAATTVISKKKKSGLTDAQKALIKQLADAPIEDKVSGACRTPEEAWLTLLYWLQKGTRWKPEKAVACLETSHLDKKTAQLRAIQLKEILDSEGSRVDVDAAPANPDYVDVKSQRAVYYDPAVRADFGSTIRVARVGDQWLFPRATVDAVPDLYPAFAAKIQRILPEWTRTRIFGVELWKLLGIIVLVTLARFLSLLVVKLIRKQIASRLAKNENSFFYNILKHGERPIAGLVMAAVLYLGTPSLLLPLKAAQLAVVATKALTVLSIVWLGYRIIDAISDIMQAKADETESKLDDQLVPLVAKTSKVVVSIVGLVFILQNLNVNVGSLVAGLGLGGLAFALAARDTIANFFGSIMIFIDKPFQIGDWIVIGDTEGVVEEVGFRTSRVRTFYSSLVTVPNSLVTNAMVDNYGRRQYRRYSTTLGLCYDTPPDKVHAFCEGVRAIIRANPLMRHDYYVVEFKGFGASSLDVMVYCFTTADTYNDEMRVRTNLNLEILRLAEDLGVSFAFPTRTLHLQSAVNMGENQPTHFGPKEAEEFGALVRSYGPGGDRALPAGRSFAPEFDCGVDTRGGDGE